MSSSPRAPTPRDLHQHFHRALLQVHQELRDGAAAIRDALAREPVDLVSTHARIGAFCRDLLDHHKAEDRFYFPAFRQAGRLRSSDAAFLDLRDAEHVDIHRLCLALRDDGVADQPVPAWTGRVASLIEQLQTLSAPHFAAEEEALVPEHLRTMITSDQLAALHRHLGQHWNRT